MRNEYDFKDLIQKYRLGKCTEAEKSVLESWLINELKHSSPLPDHDQILAADQRMQKVIEQHLGVERRSYPIWPKLVAAVAAAITILFIGLYFYTADKPIASSKKQLIAQDIPPGKTGATLTLSNGKKISLGGSLSGEIAKEAAVSITKTADDQLVYQTLGDKKNATASGALNTLSTARGEIYVLTLPDKSKVWLNAASSISYSPDLLEHGIRKVILRGEAYFEISRDKAHPFIVATEKQEVEVLGTHFNINSYADETIEQTTLLEGSLRVKAKGTQIGAAVVLKPGEQSTLSQSKMLSVHPADPDQAVAWKNGLFEFDHASLEMLMRQVSRWYNVDIVYPDKMPQRSFNGKVYRNMSLTKVLEVLNFSEVNYSISGRTITILK